MNIDTLRGLIMSPDYYEKRYLAMERESDMYWKDWLSSQDNADIHQCARYRRKAYYYLRKLHQL